MKKSELLKHLNIDEVALENDYIEKYMRYCENLAIRFQLPYQNVLASRSISLWYNYELAKLENEACLMLEISKADWNEKRNIYARTLARIFVLHPSALIEELKKVEIVNPPIPYN